MVSSLVLRNFQSHQKTKLVFSPNVNAIIGSSNSGKTAILRGLYWLINNRPNGNAFISYWNRDKKGNPLKSTFIQIQNDTHFIRRIKSPKMNGYSIYPIEAVENQIDLEAIKFDVPEQIEKILNIGEVNIQQQMDAPFLLSESASEVARFLNKEIRLDLIDKILGNAENKRRKYNQEIKQLEADIVQIETEIENYSMLEKAEKLNNRLKEIEDREKEIEDDIEYLELKISDYEKYDKISKSYSKISFKNIDSIITELENIKYEERELTGDIEDLENYKESYKAADRTINENEVIITRLLKNVPALCPVCGNKMEHNKC